MAEGPALELQMWVSLGPHLSSPALEKGPHVSEVGWLEG